MEYDNEFKANKRKEFETMDKKPSQSRESLFFTGVKEGSAKAREDFYSDKVDYEHFTLDKNFDELKDYYGLGYEMAYLKQLAELNHTKKVA